MRIPRLFLDENLYQGQTLCLKDELAHRLLHVLRVKEGYQLYLFNGQGDQFHTEVTSCSRKAVELSALGPAESCLAKESPLKIHLVQAISKTDRMDWALQKAVEMGVQEITPIVTEYTHLKRSSSIYESKQRHFEKVIIHAMEQSGRGLMPTLNPITDFHSQLAADHVSESTLYLSPRGQRMCSNTIQSHASQPITLYIGGEGGFSAEEESRMADKSWTPLCLGPRILRTETAPVAILAILQFLAGDF